MLVSTSVLSYRFIRYVTAKGSPYITIDFIFTEEGNSDLHAQKDLTLKTYFADVQRIETCLPTIGRLGFLIDLPSKMCDKMNL